MNCSYCGRNEKECEEQTELERNPITEWSGIGLSCDECYYKNHPEPDEDEDKPYCCGKHCDETEGLKLGMGWYRHHLSIAEMITEQLWCEECFKENTGHECKGCSEYYPYTEMTYKEGGAFGNALYCYDQFFCKSCIDNINSIFLYDPDEWEEDEVKKPPVSIDDIFKSLKLIKNIKEGEKEVKGVCFECGVEVWKRRFD